MYGGHITDPWDRRTNNVYLEVCGSWMSMLFQMVRQRRYFMHAEEYTIGKQGRLGFSQPITISCPLFLSQVMLTAGLFSGMELGPGFKAPDPSAHDFEVGNLVSVTIILTSVTV